jgi:hypothetical protein
MYGFLNELHVEEFDLEGAPCDVTKFTLPVVHTVRYLIIMVSGGRQVTCLDFQKVRLLCSVGWVFKPTRKLQSTL